jgi:hypothetical protein
MTLTLDLAWWLVPALLTFVAINAAVLWPANRSYDPQSAAFYATYRLMLACMFTTVVWIAAAAVLK